MRKLRIAIIAPEYPPNITGGGGPLYAALAEGLSNSGHQVLVAHADYSGQRGFRSGPVDVLSIPLPPTPRWFPFLRTALPPYPSGIISLNAALARFKPDIVHLHGYGLPYIDAASALLRRKRIPYVLTVHGFPRTPGRYGSILKKCYDFYVSVATRQTVRGARAVSGISAFVAASDELKQVKTQIILNGGRMFDRRVFNDQRGSNVLFAYGRLAFDKGFQYLIRAMPDVRRQVPTMKLVIAGADHGAKTYLEELARSECNGAVLFTGPLNRERIRRYLHDAFAVAVPSEEEPFGIVALEVLSAGVPLVASRSGAIPEIVRDRIDGLLHDPKNPRDIGAKILELRGRDLYESLADNGPSRAALFSWERMVANYERFYEKVLNA